MKKIKRYGIFSLDIKNVPLSNSSTSLFQKDRLGEAEAERQTMFVTLQR